ncbi:C40 family peptidase [Frigoribacterium sp. 2-23]|uniref:C40 family peptidase n=1 Tax=Frigoribacterium sp. 2-23 TaxID=3415006 RepID=UPI003C6EB21D
MSPVSDVLSRIHDIQNTIAQLRGTSSLAGSGSATGAGAGTNATSASAFAQALGVTGASSASGVSGLGAGGLAADGLATAPSVDAVKGAVATGSGASGADVVAGAKKYLGVPYVFGGETAAGMDCSGLVQRVFADLGVSMPRVVPDQAKMGAAVPSLAEAKPGDLLIPKGQGHIVIYLGDGKVLHAPRPGKDVQIVDNWYKDSDLSTIRRIVPGTLAASASVGTASVGGASAGASVGASSQTDMMTAALKQLMSSEAIS